MANEIKPGTVLPMSDEPGRQRVDGPMTDEQYLRNAIAAGLTPTEYQAFKTFWFYHHKYAYMGPSWVERSDGDDDPNHIDIMSDWWDRVLGRETQ